MLICNHNPSSSSDFTGVLFNENTLELVVACRGCNPKQQLPYGIVRCPKHPHLHLPQIGWDDETRKVKYGCVLCDPSLFRTCICCQHATLPERGGWELCPVCGWEDGDTLMDGLADVTSSVQTGPGCYEVTYNSEPNEEAVSGCNHISLRQARQNYAAFGACDEHCARWRVTIRQFNKAVETNTYGKPGWDATAREFWPE